MNHHSLPFFHRRAESGLWKHMEFLWGIENPRTCFVPAPIWTVLNSKWKFCLRVEKHGIQASERMWATLSRAKLMARLVFQSISKSAALVGCPRSAESTKSDPRKGNCWTDDRVIGGHGSLMHTWSEIWSVLLNQTEKRASAASEYRQEHYLSYLTTVRSITTYKYILMLTVNRMYLKRFTHLLSTQSSQRTSRNNHMLPRQVPGCPQRLTYHSHIVGFLGYLWVRDSDTCGVQKAVIKLPTLQ